MNDQQHPCRWPGCEKTVRARAWGCGEHWLAIPASLRLALWLEFRPGQEVDGNVTPGYGRAAQAIDKWVAAHVERLGQEDDRYAAQIQRVIETAEREKNRAKTWRRGRSRSPLF